MSMGFATDGFPREKAATRQEETKSVRARGAASKRISTLVCGRRRAPSLFDRLAFFNFKQRRHGWRPSKVLSIAPRKSEPRILETAMQVQA